MVEARYKAGLELRYAPVVTAGRLYVSTQDGKVVCFCIGAELAGGHSDQAVSAEGRVGECHELYLAVLKERCVRDGLDVSPETLNRQFRLHLHRGINYLATPGKIRGIGDLAALAAVQR